MVVQRGHLEDAVSLPVFFLGYLEVGHLQYHRQVLHKEDETQQRYEQFLAYQDGEHSEDASQCEGTGVSHEYLCRVGVIPKESYERPHEGAGIYRQLLRPRYVHDIQVAGVDYIAA